MSFSEDGPLLLSRFSFDPDADGYLLAPVAASDWAFDRVGLMVDAEREPRFDLRVTTDAGRSWSRWQPMSLTWSEGAHHNLHADLPHGGTHVQLRLRNLDPSQISFLHLEGFVFEPEVGELDFESEGDLGLATATHALAANSCVDVTRAQWGARASRCTATHHIRRVTIHHTDTPNSDTDMAARVRQIQNYSMDTKGYCDTMYHFFVGRDGKVYEGRVETHRGAHVLHHNVDNAGVAFIGRYHLEIPSTSMLNAGTRILAAIKQHYGIALNRTTVKGHRELRSTTCPGDHLFTRMDTMIDAANSGGGCTPTCQGTVLVSSDCSTIDCASTGEECLSGPPPRCAEPPPPEPSAAALVPGASLPTMQKVGSLSRFSFVSPRRLFDTRSNATSTNLTRGDGTTSGPMTPGQPNVFHTGSAGLPSGTTAVWLNMTAVPLQSAGYLTVYPTGQSMPVVSHLNYVPGLVRANAMPASLGTSSRISFYTPEAVHALADLSGAFTPTGAGLTTTAPTRVFDSRSTGAPVSAGEVVEVNVRAPSGTTGVIASLAVIGGSSPGYVTAFPCGGAVPDTSNLNFPANTVVTNTIVSSLGNGRLCVFSSSQAHIIVDVTGYLSPTGPLSFQALAARRLLDTRSPTSLYTGRLGIGQVIELPVQSLPGLIDDVGAVVINLTATGATHPGYLTVFPCGGSVPQTSSLNYSNGGAVAALAVSGLGSSGSVCVYAHTRTHLIVDVLGVWMHDQTEPPAPDEPADPTPPPTDSGDEPLPPPIDEEPAGEDPPEGDTPGDDESDSGNSGGSEPPFADEPGPDDDEHEGAEITVDDDDGASTIGATGQGCSTSQAGDSAWAILLLLTLLTLRLASRP